MATERDKHIQKLMERAKTEKQRESLSAPPARRQPVKRDPRATPNRPNPTASRTQRPSEKTAPTKQPTQPVERTASRPSPQPKRPVSNPIPEQQRATTTQKPVQRPVQQASQRPPFEPDKRTKTAPQKPPKLTKQTKAEPKVKPVKPPKAQPAPDDYPDRYIWGSLALIFASGYIAISCVSFFFYWQADQNIASWSGLFKNINQDALNWGGRVGSIFSQYIIGDWFGIFGLLLPVAIMLLALKVLHIPSLRLFKTVRSTLIIMLVGSVAMGNFAGINTNIFGSGLGGEMGIYIAQWLQSIIGYPGTSLMMVVASAATLYFATSKRIKQWASNMFEALERLKEQQELRRKEAALRQQIVMAELAEHNAKLRERAIVDRYDKVDPAKVAYPTTDEKSVSKAEPESIAQPNEANEADIQPEQSTSVTPGNDTEEAPADPISEIPTAPLRDFSEQLLELDNGQLGFLAGYDTLGEAIIYYFDSYRIDEMLYAPEIEYDADYNPYLESEQLENEDPEDDIEFTVTDITEEPLAQAPLSHQPIFEEQSSLIQHAHNQAATSASLQEPSAAQTTTSIPLKIVNNPTAKIPAMQMPHPAATSTATTLPLHHTAHEEISTRKVIHFAPSKDDPNFIVEQQINEEEIEDHIINLSELYDPTLELAHYQKPPVELMQDHSRKVSVSQEELVDNKNRIVGTLENFGIRIDSIEATIGPTVTLYEIIPAPGVRISKIKNLEDDIALSLSALGIRIIAPIPGKGTIGIEVPNKDKEIVSMYSVIKSAKFHDSTADLPVALGKTIQNETFVLDLAKMPHLLVAGATGQGKSVGLNAIITSLLYKKHPAELKFILIDPKKVELTLYQRLEKHFLAKMPDAEEAIITDTQKVIYTLNSICIEMDGRYDLLKAAKVRNIKEYNEKFINRRLNPNKGHRFLPYFVVIVDEFADLIMTAGREIETPIARIAQLARAVGIHLIIATQRPTTNIITGVIKANFPARIAFRVTSMIDSRTILDSPGANQLVGRGDMLVSTGSEVTRVQCAFIDTPEVEMITDHIGNQRGYASAYELPEYVPEGEASSQSSSEDMSRRDSLFEEVARYVVGNQSGSASTIQRKFSIGFNRAGRIVDQLEAVGIVGRNEGSKPRQVLIQDLISLEMILNNL